ncbi:MAG: DNA-processing protein DprA [Oscillospiraceae bacterium]|nr:DNA-processing protein DprA [Oscillospiraceae bacterium]
MAALKYWVWLTTVPRLTNHSRWLLLEHFSSPEEIYYAEQQQIRLVAGLSSAQADLLEQRSLHRAEEILSDCAAKDIFILTVQDAAYPTRLRQIYDAPILLYGKGAMPLFDDEAAVTVVGTRGCTPYGVQVAEQLGYEMAKQGAIVVSGLAKGIDTAAHRGALRAGGFTAAILGCGVDTVYPVENRKLYEDILATGVLLSEYPPGSAPERWHFPERNRIMSGLSLATVVVEADKDSGALITAHTAAEQGRDVFAVPGPIHAKESRGCNQLIRDGAGLVTEGWDVLREYQSRYAHRLHCDKTKLPDLPEGGVAPEQQMEAVPVKELPVLGKTEWKQLTDDQIQVLRILDTAEGMLTDDIAEEIAMPVRRVLSALTMLEVDGYVTQQSARRFVRAVEIMEEKKEG